MNPEQGENSERELLDAHCHVWNYLFSFIRSMSLKSAIQLGIPDIIHKHGGPMALPDLASALCIHPTKASGLDRLMRILIHDGFFKNDEEGGGYVLTSASRLVMKDNPFGAAPFFLAMLDPVLIDPWHQLSKWFQNSDVSPFATAHGSPIFEVFGQQPKVSHFFNEAMASDSRFISNLLVHDKRRGVLEGIGSLTDVGGGVGTMATALARAFPELTCTVFDLPHVVADLEDTRYCKFIGGDMFECVPVADAVLLKWILHGWNDEDCVKILKRCKEAIDGRDGGKVIVIDMIVNHKINGDKQIETQLFFDMLMMTVSTGRERTEKQWAKLIADAGFTRYEISHQLGLRSIIEIFP
uniref:N-acetylserotonin methyltransferase n=1 Tax=Hypericum tomentosum TaxID=1137039 RepID=A0A224XH25_9ROSI